MSFTNDEKPLGFNDAALKRLKESDSNALIPVYKLDALIARLEAAEAVIKYLVHIPLSQEKEHPCPHCKAMSAWEQAAGKGTE